MHKNNNTLIAFSFIEKILNRQSSLIDSITNFNNDTVTQHAYRQYFSKTITCFQEFSNSIEEENLKIILQNLVKILQLLLIYSSEAIKLQINQIQIIEKEKMSKILEEEQNKLKQKIKLGGVNINEFRGIDQAFERTEKISVYVATDDILEYQRFSEQKDDNPNQLLHFQAYLNTRRTSNFGQNLEPKKQYDGIAQFYQRIEREVEYFIINRAGYEHMDQQKSNKDICDEIINKIAVNKKLILQKIMQKLKQKLLQLYKTNISNAIFTKKKNTQCQSDITNENLQKIFTNELELQKKNQEMNSELISLRKSQKKNQKLIEELKNQNKGLSEKKNLLIIENQQLKKQYKFTKNQYQLLIKENESLIREINKTFNTKRNPSRFSVEVKQFQKITKPTFKTFFSPPFQILKVINIVIFPKQQKTKIPLKNTSNSLNEEQTRNYMNNLTKDIVPEKSSKKVFQENAYSLSKQKNKESKDKNRNKYQKQLLKQEQIQNKVQNNKQKTYYQPFQQKKNNKTQDYIIENKQQQKILEKNLTELKKEIGSKNQIITQRDKLTSRKKLKKQNEQYDYNNQFNKEIKLTKKIERKSRNLMNIATMPSVKEIRMQLNPQIGNGFQIKKQQDLGIKNKKQQIQPKTIQLIKNQKKLELISLIYELKIDPKQNQDHSKNFPSLTQQSKSRYNHIQKDRGTGSKLNRLIQRLNQTVRFINSTPKNFNNQKVSNLYIGLKNSKKILNKKYAEKMKLGKSKQQQEGELIRILKQNTKHNNTQFYFGHDKYHHHTEEQTNEASTSNNINTLNNVQHFKQNILTEISEDMELAKEYKQYSDLYKKKVTNLRKFIKYIQDKHYKKCGFFCQHLIRFYEKLNIERAKVVKGSQLPIPKHTFQNLD